MTTSTDAQGDAQKRESVESQGEAMQKARDGFASWSAEVDAAFNPTYLQGAEHGWFAALRTLEENLRVAGTEQEQYCCPYCGGDTGHKSGCPAPDISTFGADAKQDKR